ncbi:MAG: peptidoglycan editing factor PgeF [Herminiimonas sp.]|nr:peptidoglycan editing factor PgeF [Herminiimonas sp.]
MPRLIRPDWIGAPANISAFSTQRIGGVSDAPYDDGSGSGTGGLNLGTQTADDADSVLRNRAILRALLPAEPVWLRQVHGNVVVDAATVGSTEIPQADASFTSRAGVVCAVMTADCLPVLLCDRDGSVVGVAHAGWRGLAGGVLQNTIAAMRRAGAGDLQAWLGPAIGPDRFEVGAEVLEAFVGQDPRAAAAFRSVAGQPGKFMADLYHLARLILGNSDVTRIAGGAHCTMNEPARFYSYRRDHETGRMATLIWIN